MTFDQLALRSPKGENCVLLSGNYLNYLKNKELI